MSQLEIVTGANRPARAASVLMALAGMVVTGCALGPTYHRPEATSVVAHNLNEQQFTAAAPAPNRRQQVDDPELASLERRALAGDLDLQIALQRVQAARGVFRGAKLLCAAHSARRRVYALQRAAAGIQR